MILCAGAASRRVIEEAAKLEVHQIVASRRQVGEFEPGYTGMDSSEFVETVKRLSDCKTHVVRDHGGPFQNGKPDDDWIEAFEADVAAGFDVLHIDVCKLAEADQAEELQRLCKRFKNRVNIEIGGERDDQLWLNDLLNIAYRECQPSAAVADLGGKIWADRQYGALIDRRKALDIAAAYSQKGVVLKAHNCDWMGGRRDYKVPMMYNIAPELGNVEVDAWLHVLYPNHVNCLLNYAYDSGAWKRWFNEGEGTRMERSRAALRYHLESPVVRAVLEQYDDTYVRKAIRDAIHAG